MHKKSQIWTIDLVAGVSIFMIMIVVYFIFTNNISDYEKDNTEQLYSSSYIVSNSLISEGYPINWTASNVSEIGLTNGDYRLNSTKIFLFKTLDYSQTKTLLKINHEYMFFFQDTEENIIPINGTDYFGKPGITKDNIKSIENPDNLVGTRRFVINKNKIITMVIYLWD